MIKRADIKDSETLASLAIQMWPDNDTAGLTEEFRSKGIAVELLSECEKWAKDNGCTEFASDCELGNDDSLKFHMAMGFEETNRFICFKKTL